MPPAVLLFLALASYSPTDPSLNTAASASQAPNNWIGLFGAMISDLLIQSMGVCAFLVPVMIGFLAARWFKSRGVVSPGAKALGASILLIFGPALLALLPWHLRWLGAVAMEGLLGRIVGDALLHYFNLVGAYIVSATVVAVALYLSTAFSFAASRIWLQTRFAFAFAAWQRLEDWRAARAKKKAEKEVQKRRLVSETPSPVAQMVATRAAQPGQARTGIERTFEEIEPLAPVPAGLAGVGNAAGVAEQEPAIAERADLERKTKTLLPKIAAGSYKLPSSALLHRADEQQAINEEELQEPGAGAGREMRGV